MKDKVIEPSIPYTGLNNNQIGATYNNPDAHGAKHFVMWSGGTDSTLLLYELLKTYGPSNVITIAYRYPWLTAEKAELEKKHRIAFIAYASLHGLGGFKHLELDINQKDLNGNFSSIIWPNQGAGLPQAVAWMLSVPLYASEGSYIYDGGIRNDDLTLRLESYHEMFRGIAGVLRRDLSLREPYLHLTKENILEKLIAYDIYDFCWFCETPRGGKLCGSCTSCKTHHHALDFISRNSEDEYVRMRATHLLQRFDAKDVAAVSVNLNKDKERPLSLVGEK